MKTIAMIVAAAAVTASVGAASAQEARSTASSTFESVVPFAGSDAVTTGRSAYVDGADTSHVYGDGSYRLAPHVNGIF